MIKGITANSPWVTVQNGNTSNYINNYSGAQGVGNLRFNTTNQNMEVWDGNNWVQLSMSYASVDLSPEAQVLLNWAQQERNRQLKRQQLINDNPALKKAYEAIQRAEANFDIIEKFVENDPLGEQAESVQSSP